MMHIEALNPSNREAAIALLRRYKESSLFLLGNLALYGATLGESLNSGNYRCVVDDGRVVAVFVLARRGNLLAQTDRAADYSPMILDACAEEPISVQGFIGDWAVMEPLWRRYGERHPAFTSTYVNQEFLFRRPTRPTDGAPTLTGITAASVRFLTPADFEVWDALQIDFLTEEGLPVQGTREERQAGFLEKVAKRHWWGYEQDGRLMSMAAYNTCVDGTGQVGGVYTPPEFRRRGLSRAVMETLIADSARVHHLEGLVLFTGESNHPAQALYRSLGFEAIGRFALIFGH